MLAIVSLKPLTSPFTWAPSCLVCSLGSSRQWWYWSEPYGEPYEWTLWRIQDPHPKLGCCFLHNLFISKDPQLTCFSAPKQKHIWQNWCWRGVEPGNLRTALLKDNLPKGKIINSTNQGIFSWIYRNSSLLCPINMSIFQAIFLSWDERMISVRWSSYSPRIFTFMALKAFTTWEYSFLCTHFQSFCKDGLCILFIVQ